MLWFVNKNVFGIRRYRVWKYPCAISDKLEIFIEYYQNTMHNYLQVFHHLNYWMYFIWFKIISIQNQLYIQPKVFLWNIFHPKNCKKLQSIIFLGHVNKLSPIKQYKKIFRMIRGICLEVFKKTWLVETSRRIVNRSFLKM